MADYWNHNTAYHDWILKQIKLGSQVLDVGCGDGLLVQKLADIAEKAVGIEPHGPSAQAAKRRLHGVKNAQIMGSDLESFSTEKASLDTIIFVASIHHMPLK